MGINLKTIVHVILVVIGVLVLIPVFALGALAVSARFSDGPSIIFSGGPLVAGELVTGPEPDWSFVRNVRTFELQLVNPPRSRRLWIVDHEGKLYLNSNYIGGLRENLRKRWPAQAERDGRAIVEAIAAEFTRKYGVV